MRDAKIVEKEQFVMDNRCYPSMVIQRCARTHERQTLLSPAAARPPPTGSRR